MVLNKKKWFGNASISDKLFMPVLKDLFLALIEHKQLKSSRYFSEKYNHSYMQVYKYKHWLISKGVIEIIKEGRSEILKPTKKGIKLLKCIDNLFKLFKEEQL